VRGTSPFELRNDGTELRDFFLFFGAGDEVLVKNESHSGRRPFSHTASLIQRECSVPTFTFTDKVQ
jgi:hypothetical protein